MRSLRNRLLPKFDALLESSLISVVINSKSRVFFYGRHFFNQLILFYKQFDFNYFYLVSSSKLFLFFFFRSAKLIFPLRRHLTFFFFRCLSCGRHLVHSNDERIFVADSKFSVRYTGDSKTHFAFILRHVRRTRWHSNRSHQNGRKLSRKSLNFLLLILLLLYFHIGHQSNRGDCDESVNEISREKTKKKGEGGRRNETSLLTTTKNFIRTHCFTLLTGAPNSGQNDLWKFVDE